MGNVKGTLLQTRIEYLDEKCTSVQKKAVISELSPEIREVVEKGVVPITWYPIHYYYDLLKAINRVLGKPGDYSVINELGKYTAYKALRGIYKIFIKIGSPDFYIKRSPMVWDRLFDFGKLKVDSLGKGSNVMTLEGFDNLPPEFAYALKGWIEGMLEICGAKNISIQITQQPKPGNQILKMEGKWDV